MIETRQLSVSLGSFELRDVNLRVPAGAYCVLMGRTGCGKTTLLEAICGLKRVRGGSIWLSGQEVTRLKPGARGVGFVPQEGALFPHLTVEEHLRFALEIRRWPKEEIARRVDWLTERLGLKKLLARTPHGLSGGERQRVALGRALAFEPAILCLDEPLSALDDDTRGEIIALLKSVHAELGVTALHVTHNRSEAARLADLTLQFVDGRLEEVSSESPPLEHELRRS